MMEIAKSLVMATKYVPELAADEPGITSSIGVHAEGPAKRIMLAKSIQDGYEWAEQNYRHDRFHFIDDAMKYATEGLKAAHIEGSMFFTCIWGFVLGVNEYVKEYKK